MALKVGELYVAVGAKMDFTGISKAVKRGIDSVKKFGSQLKAVGTDAQTLATVVGGFMAGAVAIAAKNNAKVASAVQRIKTDFMAFATDIGTALLPVLKSFADSLGQLVNWFRSLSPEAKNTIAQVLKITAVALTAAVAIGRIGYAISAIGSLLGLVWPLFTSLISAVGTGLAAMAGGVVEAFGAIAAAVTAPITGTVLLIAAAVAAVIALGYGIYKAWTTDFGGIREKVTTVADWIGNAFGQAWDWVKKAFASVWDTIDRLILRPFTKALTWLRDKFFGFIGQQLALLQKALSLLGIQAPKTFAFLNSLNDWGKNLFTEQGIKSLATDAVHTFSVIGSGIKSGVLKVAAKAGEALKSVEATVKKYIPNLSGFSKTVKFGPAVLKPKLADLVDADGLTKSLRTVTPYGYDAKHEAALDQLQKELDTTGKLKDRMALVNELYGAGRISSQVYFDQLTSYLEQTNKGFALLKDAATTVMDDLQQGFVAMAEGVKGAFGSMVQSILKDLAQLAAKKAFTMLLNLGLNAIGAAVGGGSSSPPVIGNDAVMSAVNSVALRAAVPAAAAGGTVISAPVTVAMNVTSAPGANGGGPSEGDAHALAKGLKRAVQKHLDDEMRPGGSLYNFARAR